MKKILYIILVLVVSCKPERKEKGVVEGYYFNRENSRIYNFDNYEMTVYNILDSTLTSQNVVLSDNIITINSDRYNYRNFNKDSIIIYNYFENNNDISLIKFDFKNFDVNELNGSNWSLNFIGRNGIKRDQYLKFDEDERIHFFSNVNGDRDTIYFNEILFNGKFFNKFNVYVGSSVSIFGSYTKSNLCLLNIEEIGKGKFIAENYTLKKVHTKKINPLLIGKWYKTNKKNPFNNRTYFKHTYKIDERDKDFEIKMDSVEKLLDYSKIEFTDNQELIRYLNKEQMKVIYKVNNTPVSKYIFVNNPDFVTQYFEIKSVTQDSLVIEISEPNFIYNYVRDSVMVNNRSD